jgi:hypothetical protein
LGFFSFGLFLRAVILVPNQRFIFIKNELVLIKNNGFMNFDFTRCFIYLFFPIILNLSIFILLPYTIVFGFLNYYLGFLFFNIFKVNFDFIKDIDDLNLIFKFIYFILSFLYFLNIIYDFIYHQFLKLHNYVKDQRYLVQRRIVNINE